MPVGKKHVVALSPQEKETLTTILRKGKNTARTIMRARVLLLVNDGGTDVFVSQQIGVSRDTVRNVRKRYHDGGLDRALFDAPRSGQPSKLNEKQKAKITAIACTDPPDGYGRWTLDLLETAVASQVKKVSRQTVYHVLLASDLKPWREKNVVHRDSQ